VELQLKYIGGRDYIVLAPPRYSMKYICYRNKTVRFLNEKDFFGAIRENGSCMFSMDDESESLRSIIPIKKKTVRRKPRRTREEIEAERMATIKKLEER